MALVSLLFSSTKIFLEKKFLYFQSLHNYLLRDQLFHTIIPFPTPVYHSCKTTGHISKACPLFNGTKMVEGFHHFKDLPLLVILE